MALGLGKSSWNVYRTSNESFTSLRFSGQTGVAINLYLLDGGLFDSLERKFTAKHLLYYRCGSNLGDQAFTLEMSDWTFGMLGPSHCCSNGLKWSVSIFSDKEIIKLLTLRQLLLFRLPVLYSNRSINLFSAT